mmetsp:Transcript_11618/g.15137  ORF Transcript_11618/g.15137 Transcript_11618/m.15137 type:complete len:205 (+) Transcript_11618:378-992(+)
MLILRGWEGELHTVNIHVSTFTRSNFEIVTTLIRTFFQCSSYTFCNSSSIAPVRPIVFPGSGRTNYFPFHSTWPVIIFNIYFNCTPNVWRNFSVDDNWNSHTDVYKRSCIRASLACLLIAERYTFSVFTFFTDSYMMRCIERAQKTSVFQIIMHRKEVPSQILGTFHVLEDARHEGGIFRRLFLFSEMIIKYNYFVHMIYSTSP